MARTTNTQVANTEVEAAAVGAVVAAAETTVVAVTFEQEIAKVDALLADPTLTMLHAELSKVRNSVVKQRMRELQQQMKAVRALLVKQPRKAKASATA